MISNGNRVFTKEVMIERGFATFLCSKCGKENTSSSIWIDSNGYQGQEYDAKCCGESSKWVSWTKECDDVKIIRGLR